MPYTARVGQSRIIVAARETGKWRRKRCITGYADNRGRNRLRSESICPNVGFAVKLIANLQPRRGVETETGMANLGKLRT